MILLAACHVDPPPSPPPTCAQIADHMQARTAARESDRDVLVQTHEVFAQRCTTDAWATEVMRCIVDEPAGQNHHCRDKLTEPQRHALDAALGNVFSPVQTAEQYRAVVTRVLDAMLSIMASGDCAKIAADVTAYAARHKREMESAKAWKKDHPEEAQKIGSDMMSVVMQKMGPAMQTMTRCQKDPAFQAAIKALK